MWTMRKVWNKALEQLVDGLKCNLLRKRKLDKAEEVLDGWTRYLLTHPGEQVVLVGTMTHADGDRPDRGEGRLQAVKATWEERLRSQGHDPQMVSK